MNADYAAHVTTAEWNGFVMATARLNGWAIAERASTEPGFPDLIAIRDGHLLVWKLTTVRGKVTAAQEKWLALFAGAGADARAMRPSDQAEVIAVLTAPRGLGAMTTLTGTTGGPSVELSGQDAAQ